MAKKILVLGAGAMLSQLLGYLVKKGYDVTVGSRTLKNAIENCKPYGVHPIKIDVDDEKDLGVLDEEIKKNDLVISILPYLLHPIAAKYALKHNTHFLTASYLSPAMKELDAEAREKGLFFMNECGVDPGTDHMSACRVFDEHKNKGGKIRVFTSFCGGLPAPADNNNPFGYKFSWAPRGVLLAARNPAKFLLNGSVKEVANIWEYSAELSEELGDKLSFSGNVFSSPFEGVPNRDSTIYKDIYDLPDIKTIIRGTFRYQGWADIFVNFLKLDLLSVEPLEFEGTHAEYIAKLVGGDASNVKAKTAEKLGRTPDHKSLEAMEWLGLFSDEKVTAKTPLDIVYELMVSKEKLKYAEGEKDMIAMKHAYEVEYENETHYLSTELVDYALDNGASSMSRTVGLPAAIAADLFLSGKFPGIVGCVIPTIPELYNPILAGLEEEGIKFVDRVDKIVKKDQ